MSKGREDVRNTRRKGCSKVVELKRQKEDDLRILDVPLSLVFLTFYRSLTIYIIPVILFPPRLFLHCSSYSVYTPLAFKLAFTVSLM